MERANDESNEEASLDMVRQSLKYLMGGGTYAAAIEFDESKAESLYALGHTQYLQGHYVEAMRFFGFILTCDPLNYRAMQAMAACMQMTGKHGQALLLLGSLLVAQEDNRETSLQIINCLIHLGRHSEAMKVIGAVEAALKAGPSDVASQQRVNGYRQLAQQASAVC